MTFSSLRAAGLAALLLAGSLAAQSLSIVNTSFPPGAPGVQYAQGLSVLGGTAPYTWSLTSGSLPPGLTLNPVGAIVGVPTTSGTYPFTLMVTDSRQQTATRSLSITIAGASFAITTTSPLPAGTAGQAYSQTLAVTGGTAPYQWAAGSGLPPGVSLSATSGTLSGTPTTAGTYNFAVQVTDSAQKTATANFALTINAGALTITTIPPLFTGAVGQAYSQTFTAAGGQQPYTWAIASGSAGNLSLDSATGILSGTPQTAGALNFTIRVTDRAGATAQQSFSITITPPALTLTATSTVLPAGSVGVAYAQKLPLVPVGGTAPFTWSLTTPSVPGLTFDPVGVALNGTPTTAGTFSVTVQVNDAAGLNATKTLSLTIAGAALTITTARALPDAALNAAYSQTLSAAGGIPPYVWSVTGLPTGLTINSATGVISGTPTAAGNFPLAITVTDNALTHFVDRFTINVNLPSAPPVTISGLPASAGPAQQYTLRVSLGSAYTADITGQLILTFSPDTGPSDQTVQFASGGTTASFTIPAGSTTATSSVPLALQTGTVSGTLSVSLRLQAGGIDITPSPAPSISTQVPQGAPVISKVQVTRTSTTLTVVVTGYCTARQLSQGIFNFSAVAGQSLQSTASTVTIDLGSLFNTWFQDAANSKFGTQFIFTQPFTIQGDPNNVVPVSVTLSNRVGSTSANVQN